MAQEGETKKEDTGPPECWKTIVEDGVEKRLPSGKHSFEWIWREEDGKRIWTDDLQCINCGEMKTIPPKS